MTADSTCWFSGWPGAFIKTLLSCILLPRPACCCFSLFISWALEEPLLCASPVPGAGSTRGSGDHHRCAPRTMCSPVSMITGPDFPPHPSPLLHLSPPSGTHTSAQLRGSRGHPLVGRVPGPWWRAGAACLWLSGCEGGQRTFSLTRV